MSQADANTLEDTADYLDFAKYSATRAVLRAIAGRIRSEAAAHVEVERQRDALLSFTRDVLAIAEGRRAGTLDDVMAEAMKVLAKATSGWAPSKPRDTSLCPYQSHAADCECRGMGGDR